MREMHRIAAPMALLLTVWVATASAQNSQNNDSVDYTPAVKTVAGTLPVSQSYELGISAPTQLNMKSLQELQSGVVTTLRVNVAAYPLDSSAAEAAALVSLDTWTMTFHALGETHYVNVLVNASAATTPGDYSFNIQAVGPPGIGWGISNHRLTVTVAAPVVVDSTPPDVVITSPVNGQTFTFCTAGTVVPVTISAVDPESFVTVVEGTVNGVPFAVSPFTPSHGVVANGSFTAADIGAYGLEASATSAGGTAVSEKVTISIGYAMSWLGPLTQGRVFNGAVPIQFAARDCEGTFVSDTRVRVEVWEGNDERFSAVFGTGSDAVRIEDDTKYIANFQPAAGNHTYTVKVFFNGYFQASMNFSTR